MAKEVRLPRLGETMNEGTIIACRVALGDYVKAGDVLFEIETDKATVEIESPSAGCVRHIIAKLGQTYPVETPLLVLCGKDEQITDEFIRSLEVPITVIKKSKSHLTAEHASSVIPRLSSIAQRETRDERRETKTVSAVKLGRRIPVTRFHRITAQKMLRSKREIPCFYLNVRADVTELVAYRTKHNESSSIKVSYNDFVIKAVAAGLEKFPIMTGQLDGDAIRLADSIGVGLAIETPDGLVAPVVKDANKKTIEKIAGCTERLIQKAGNNELAPDDLEGGCITVSNLGAYGIDSFIPIVIPGQCSILGVGRIKDACVPDDGGVNTRKIMNMTLSVDHRVANGAYAAQFLDFVKKTLETVS